MRIVCNTLWLPKKGNTNEEYEDAAAPLEDIDIETDSFRCAVADGATETSFSALWAKLLVEGYVANSDRAALKVRWAESVGTRELPWYAEQKAESGAYAALVCVTISEGKWEAEAIGDCCLVIVRDGKFVEMFPLTESEQFNSSPVLLSSNSDETAAESQQEVFVKKSGEWQKGDVFYLLSDAIARWTYKRQEEHGDAAFFLKSLNKQKDIEDFAEVQRTLMDAESRPLMRNDDVTMMRVTPS